MCFDALVSGDRSFYHLYHPGDKPPLVPDHGGSLVRSPKTSSLFPCVQNTHIKVNVRNGYGLRT